MQHTPNRIRVPSHVRQARAWLSRNPPGHKPARIWRQNTLLSQYFGDSRIIIVTDTLSCHNLLRGLRPAYLVAIDLEHQHEEKLILTS